MYLTRGVQTLFEVGVGLGWSGCVRVTVLAVILVWVVFGYVTPAWATIMSVSPPSPTANQPFTISGMGDGSPLVVFSGSGCYGSPIFSTPPLPFGAPYSITVPGQPAGRYSATDYSGSGCVNFTVN
jgi:hypothetical protein